MDWILEHLKLVIFVIVIVVYALKAMRGQSAAEGDETRPVRRTLPGEEDAAEAERTRQIQEEIRRRILARQRGEDASSSPPPLVLEEEPPAPMPMPPPLPQATQPATAEAPDAYANARDMEQASRTASILETQRALEEQLLLMRRARNAALAGVTSVGSPPASPTAGTARRASSMRRVLREDLAGRGSLRRAILLREVLGEPVGLRGNALPRR